MDDWEGAPNGLVILLGAPNGFSGVSVFDGGPKGLKGGVFGGLNGEEAAIGLGAKGFAVAGDCAVANGSDLGSAGGSANLTCLPFCPPLGVPLPPRPLTIVPC